MLLGLLHEYILQIKLRSGFRRRISVNSHAVLFLCRGSKRNQAGGCEIYLLKPAEITHLHLNSCMRCPELHKLWQLDCCSGQ
jgi:hypothetical protein